MNFKRLIRHNPIRSAFAAFFCLLIVVAFQNCNRTSFLPTTLAGGIFGGNNNGAGYGGKPSKDYARFTPGFTCQSKPAAVALVKVKDQAVSVIENKKDICEAVQLTLNIKDIDSSIYQDQIIGYQEGIFEGVKTTPTSIPANLVEVWCRDTNDQTGIETVVHFNRETNSAVNRTYYATTDINGVYINRVIDDFAVSRVVSMSQVEISDGNGFDLTVYRDQPAIARPGLFMGKLNAIINGVKQDRKTYCRFGGSLDAKVWPVKQIVDLNISDFRKTSDINFMGYISNTGIFAGLGHNLFISKTQGKDQILISKEVAPGSHFEFSPDSKALYYTTGASTTPTYNRATVDGTFNSVLATANDVLTFKLNHDASSLIYHTYIDGGVGLKSISTATGSNNILSPPVSRGTMGVSSVSFTKDKVVFLCCNRPTQIYTVNFDGSDLRVLKTPALPDASWDFATQNLAVLGQQKAISVWAWSATAGSVYMNYIIALDGSYSLKLPPGWLWVSSSLDEKFGLLVNEKDQTTQALINLLTGVMKTLPKLVLPAGQSFTREGSQTFKSAFFTKNSSEFIGLSTGGSTESAHAFSVNLIDGTTSNLCDKVTTSFVKQLGDSSLILVGHDLKRRILNVYLKNAMGCRLVNSLPFALSLLGDIEVVESPDGQSILATVKFTDPQGIAATSLFYIPLSGQAPFAVNKPVFAAAKIQQAFFLKDSKSVIFVGDQIRVDDQNIFLWTAPAP